MKLSNDIQEIVENAAMTRGTTLLFCQKKYIDGIARYISEMQLNGQNRIHSVKGFPLISPECYVATIRGNASFGMSGSTLVIRATDVEHACLDINGANRVYAYDDYSMKAVNAAEELWISEYGYDSSIITQPGCGERRLDFRKRLKMFGSPHKLEAAGGHADTDEADPLNDFLNSYKIHT